MTPALLPAWPLALPGRHLGCQSKFLPTNRGFDMWLGIPFSADMGTSVWHPAGGGSAQPTPLPLIDGTKSGGWKIVEQPVALQNLTTRYVARAGEFIHGSAVAGKPFVLYVPFNHVHNPQFCSPQWCGTSTVHGGGPAIPTGHGGTGSAVQEMDAAVGAVMQTLKDAGVDESTLVFFTSDNGAPSNHENGEDGPGRGANSPLSGYKGSVLEGGIRMPSMVRWPGKVAAGHVNAALVGTYDIFPTMLSLAGAALPPDRVIDGQDLSPMLLGQPGRKTGHECLFHYHSGAFLAAVRCGDYKLHYDEPALYDIARDPGEAHPLPNNTDPYRSIIARIDTARAAHLNTVIPVQDQIMLGNDPRYAFCADPDSRQKYPKLPICTISPASWGTPDWGPPVGPPAPSPPAPPAPIPPSAYVGCYWDKGFPDHHPEPCDLPVVKRGSCPKDLAEPLAPVGSVEPPVAPMTVELCNALCQGNLYMALQNGGSGCFCGSSYGRYGVANNCSEPCGGNRSEICGGLGINSIYHVVADVGRRGSSISASREHRRLQT